MSDIERRAVGAGTWGGLDYVWALDIGLERARNEDFLAVRHVELPGESGGALLLALADGLGGGGNGDKAARTAVEEIIRCAATWESGTPFTDWEQPWRDLHDAFCRADARIREDAARHGERPGASTLVAALVFEDFFIHVHVGDSRLYLFGPDGLEYRTRDQTLAQIQVDAGRIASEAAATPRQRNTLYSVVGGERAQLSPEPEWRPLGAAGEAPPAQEAFGLLMPGGVLILCSDGLWGQLDADALQVVASDTTRDLSSMRDRLLELAHQAGAPDNIAVILVRHTRDPARGALSEHHGVKCAKVK